MKTFLEWVEIANNVFNNKYEYNKLKYINQNRSAIIEYISLL